MSTTTRTSEKTVRLVQLSILTAIVVVLQFLPITLGTFNLSLVLVPIVIGGELLGPKASTFLGLVFGGIVLLLSATGRDLGGAMMWQANWWLTALVCLIKGAAAGLACGSISAAFSHSEHRYLGIFLAAIAAPVVNTGLFLFALTCLYPQTLSAWMAAAEYTNALLYILSGIVLVNFVPEVIANAVCAPAILRITDAVRKMK